MFNYCILVTVLHLVKNIEGGWVEIPEFSDDTKIYRMPIPKRDHHKSIQNENSNNFLQDQLNISALYEHSFQTDKSSEEENTKYYDRIPTKILTSQNTNKRYNDTFNGFSGNASIIKDSINEDDCITNKSDIHLTIPDNKLFLSRIKEDDILKMASPKEFFVKASNQNSDNLLMYMPTEILKTAHYNLKSQPPSIKGKMEFLKSLEKILSSEIELQLTNAIAPRRKTRGAEHYEHYGYEEHDDHGLGFPSTEGALMAISFLTFAVYLVRLVMLLFRNMNNTNQNTMGPTVLFGKKKRSVELDEDTVRILQSIENFVTQL